MRKLIAFFVDRPLLVNLITVFVIVAGFIVTTGMPRALLPKGRLGAVLITATLPGASAVDVERFVTFRLEEALEGIDGVEELRSTTTNGLTSIRLKLLPEAEDVTEVMEDARSRVSSVRHLLPEDLRPIEIEEAASEQVVIALLVEQIDEANPEHRQAIEALGDTLRRLPDVVAVQNGLRDLNLYIRFDHERLDRAGISVTTARGRILEFLGHMPVGGIQVRDQEVTVELSKPLGPVEDLANIPLVVNRAGRGVNLGEVAVVERGFGDELERRTLEGRPYIEMAVVGAPNADSIELSRQVHQVLDSGAAKNLPEPLKVRVGADVSEIIAHELDTLQSNGLGGVFLVLVILMLFLGWRVSSMTALGLPFSYMGVVLLLPLFGINFNLISLVAMILVIGILVDDAIIVSEEFSQGVTRGESPRDAAVNAVIRVGKPVLGMAATTSVAFLPLLLLKGGESWMIRPLPIIIIAALALSLFESFLLLPNHLRHLMPAGAKPVERRWVDWVRHGYERLLGLTLRLRYVTLVAVAGLVVATVMLLQGPVKVQGSLSLTGRSVILIELSEPAESLDALAQAVAPIEALVETLPEELQERYQTTLGRAFAVRGDEILRGWKYAQIEIYPPGSFVEKEEKRAVIAERLGDQLAELETTDAFSKLRFFIQATGEVRDVVTVYVSGGDRIDFTNIQDDIRAALGEVENVKDVFMDDSRFQRSLRFVVDQKAALSYGMSEGALHAQLREAFSRQELLRLRHRGEEIEVYLGYQAPPSADLEALETLTIMTPRGVPVPIRYLGRWTETQVLRRIEHRDGLRMFQVDVLYDQEKVEADTVADAIEAQLEPVRAKNPGYFISVKPSEFEAKGRSWMLRLVLVCVALVYLCLALALNSLVQPLVVIFAIPFGFIGVVLAFWLHGMSLGIMAIIGLLGLAGVVVNDSLVMAATINDVLAEGSGDLRRAIVAGAGRRFRAVVLTSLTTLGGVFPLAYGFAGRAGWLQPMVMAVGWGLLFATLLTLLFVPCLLLIVDDGRRFGAWLLRPLRRVRWHHS